MARSMQSDDLLQYGRPPFAAGSACYSNITFGSHGNLKFSNDQIESATRCVQTLSELTRYRIKGYCGRGVAACELVYIRRNFFLSLCRLLHFYEAPTVSENVRSSGKTGGSARGQNGEMDLKRTWLSGTQCKPFVVKSCTGVVNN